MTSIIGLCYQTLLRRVQKLFSSKDLTEETVGENGKEIHNSSNI